MKPSPVLTTTGGVPADLPCGGTGTGHAPVLHCRASRPGEHPVDGSDVTQGGRLIRSWGRAHPYAADAYELDVVLRAAVVEAVGVLVWSRGHRRESHWVVCVHASDLTACAQAMMRPQHSARWARRFAGAKGAVSARDV